MMPEEEQEILDKIMAIIIILMLIETIRKWNR